MRYEDNLSEDSDGESPKRSSSRRQQKYSAKWENEFTFLQPSARGVFYYHCKVCLFDGKAGIGEVKNHARSSRHKTALSLARQSFVQSLNAEKERSQMEEAKRATNAILSRHSEPCKDAHEKDIPNEQLRSSVKSSETVVNWKIERVEETNSTPVWNTNLSSNSHRIDLSKEADEMMQNSKRMKRNLPTGKNASNAETTDGASIFHQQPNARIEDRFDIYGRNVAMKLRDLPQTQRIITEKIINDALFEAEMGALTTAHRVIVPPRD